MVASAATPGDAGELAERGELVRRVDGSWVLRGSPPDASALGRRRAMAGRPHDLMRPVRQLPDESPGDDNFVTTLAPTASHG